jgi:hypothetical protein
MRYTRRIRASMLEGSQARNSSTDESKDNEAEPARSAPVRMPRALRRRLRAAAVAKVRQDIIHAGRNEADYAREDLEYLVAEKEKEIRSGLGWKGFGIVALLLGINIGV